MYIFQKIHNSKTDLTFQTLMYCCEAIARPVPAQMVKLNTLRVKCSEPCQLLGLLV